MLIINFFFCQTKKKTLPINYFKTLYIYIYTHTQTHTQNILVIYIT